MKRQALQPSLTPSAATVRAWIVASTLIIVGVIHLLPAVGMVGGARLTALYGMPFDDIDLAVLMRHRAVLFALLGALLVIAAFRPSLQAAAFVAGFVSVVSFLLLAWLEGPVNGVLARVVRVDIAALACLVVGAWAAYGPGSSDAAA